jgi:hypothetical protein
LGTRSSYATLDIPSACGESAADATTSTPLSEEKGQLPRGNRDTARVNSVDLNNAAEWISFIPPPKRAQK